MGELSGRLDLRAAQVERARILILGAGLSGLCTAMLAGPRRVRGHRAGTRPGRAAAAGARRCGVGRLAAARRQPVPAAALHAAPLVELLRAELPEVRYLLDAAGALQLNVMAALPAARRGPMRDGDERFETVTARRPVLEAALSAAAEAAGVTIRRGVAVTGLTTDRHARVPRVTGVLTEDGPRSPRTWWWTAVAGGRRLARGCRRPAHGARSRSGRTAASSTTPGISARVRGEQPAVLHNLLQSYDSLSVITLPADNGTWSVVLTTSSRDKALRVLREPARWHAALARYPLVAHWADGEPISGVDVMAGIEDRYRRLAIDGQPVATGVVAVGDAWACTNPSVGRGAAIALMHARSLRDLLRETDPADHDKFARRFDEVTAQAVEPLYRATLWYDRHRLAEIDADIAGTPYRTDDQRWPIEQGALRGQPRRSGPDPGVLGGGVLHRHARRGARPARRARPGHRARHGRPAVPAARPGPRRTARRDRLKLGKERDDERRPRRRNPART